MSYIHRSISIHRFIRFHEIDFFKNLIWQKKGYTLLYVVVYVEWFVSISFLLLALYYFFYINVSKNALSQTFKLPVKVGILFFTSCSSQSSTDSHVKLKVDRLSPEINQYLQMTYTCIQEQLPFD